jgi:hypothetical protein
MERTFEKYLLTSAMEAQALMAKLKQTEKAPRPVELKVKLGRLLVSEEAVRAGVSVTGTSPSSVVSLKQPQHELQRILMDILRISGGEMSASDLCSRLYQQSNFARDHVREEYG